MAAAPDASTCAEKERLLIAFTNAVTLYHRLQSAQLAAAFKGEGVRFDEQIVEAGIHKDDAKYAVTAHRSAHGC